jgi:hypothetical protein
MIEKAASDTLKGVSSLSDPTDRYRDAPGNMTDELKISTLKRSYSDIRIPDREFTETMNTTK